MNNQIKLVVREYWDQWISKRSPLTNPQILTSQNIYIVPSAFGWAYALIILTLFSGAINYQISTIFLMTFLMAVIGLVSAWEAHANLKDLSIKLIAIEDTQQGKPAQMTVLIQSNNKMRFALEFKLAEQSPRLLEKITPEGLQFILPIETSTRGCFPLPKIVISSLFPFGIFRVWGYARFDVHYYVYPEPVSPDFWPLPDSHQHNKKKYSTGDEEIYDLKQVENPWIQANLIAWKIAAKGQGWYIKTRDSSEGDLWLFKLTDLPSADIETKLQNLCYWLIHAELNGYIYSLELTKESTPFSQGDKHLQHCLRQLALFK